MRKRARDAPAAEAIKKFFEQPFQGEALFLLLVVEEEIAVIEKCYFSLCLLMCDFRNGSFNLIL